MEQAVTASGTQMLIGLALGVALLVILILRTKIYAFPAMILAAAVTGVVGGMAPTAISKSITTGFGNTLGSIGLVIGFGVMMGRILEVSGALAAAHHLVPPTPGPLGAAGIFGADIGKMILWGMVFAIPVMIVGIVYARWVGRKIYQIPTEDGKDWERREWSADLERDITLAEEHRDLPGAFISFAPILAPVVLILCNTVLSAMKMKGGVASSLIFLGDPVIAALIGLLLAIYGLGGKTDRKTILKQMEEGVQSAGIIMLVTGAGGALGQVLRDSGAGTYLAQVVANSPVPPILLPFVVATLIRLIQGSGTVAMLTAASITAPILVKLDVNPVFAAQSAAMGSFVLSYFNDSLFWVVNRLQGIEDVKEQVMTWSIPTTLAWLTSGICLVIANAIFG